MRVNRISDRMSQQKFKRQRYSGDDLEKAIDAVRRGLSVRSVSREFRIPAQTIRDKIHCKYTSGSKPGKSSVLSAEHERKIVEWIEYSAHSGLPITLKRLRISVGQFIRLTKLKTPFKNGIPGKKWMSLFIKRHPQVSARKSNVFGKHRAAVTEHQLRNWFQEVLKQLKDEGKEHLLQLPHQIFNLDESAFQMVVRNKKYLAPKDTKHVQSVFGNSDKETYTGLFAGNAAGKLLPPLIMFPYKSRLPGEIARSAPEDYGVGISDSGWMTGEAFHGYLENIFLPWLKKEKIPFPVLLFVDGHKSHVTLMSTDFCHRNQIILVALYPNSTQLTQPLDVSFFGPLKKYWEDTILDERSKRGAQTISKAEICPIMKRTLDAFKSKETAIRNGFRKSGIYPWNPDAVDYKSLPSSAGHVSVPQSAGNVGSVPLDPEEVNLLAALEGRLTVKQFTEFQKAESDVIWRGNVADTNLFYLWQGMKKDCFATEPSHRLSANARGENFDCAADCEDAGPMTEDEAGAVPVELYQIEGGCREPSASAEDCEGAGPMAEDEARAPPQESLHNERDGSSPVSDEDAFNMSFSMPISDAPGQVKKKRTVIHPPSVATSKAFVEFMEAKEREKKEIQEAKDLKRKEREQKRAIKETEMRIKKQERDKKRTNKVEPPKKTSKPRKRQK